VGLAVHLRGGLLSPNARDILGDALWAVMLAGWIGAVRPGVVLLRRSALVLAVCIVVECSQRYHTPWLDELRRTALGHLVLGSDYDPRDFVAYSLGVIAAMLLERAVRGRNAGSGMARR
jgi:hypothetical protein